jgi:hypothetical protein
MASWSDVVVAAPELAEKVRARFEATGLGYLATLRRDGSPRISGLEPLFWDGQLWIGMMPGSRKNDDVQRDPRFSLHAANVDKQVADGDARVSGRATAVTDPDVFKRFRAAFHEQTDFEPPADFPLYAADITEVMFLKPGGDHLDIEWWNPGGPPRSVKRH